LPASALARIHTNSSRERPLVGNTVAMQGRRANSVTRPRKHRSQDINETAYHGWRVLRRIQAVHSPIPYYCNCYLSYRVRCVRSCLPYGQTSPGPPFVFVRSCIHRVCFCEKLYTPWGELYKSDAATTTPKRNRRPNPLVYSTLRSNFLAFPVGVGV
jgi:hypothetical protein